MEKTIAFQTVANTYEVLTDAIDPFGDGIQLTLIKKGDSYKITDYGYTLFNIECMGVELAKHKDEIKNIVKTYGVTLGYDDNLYIYGNRYMRGNGTQKENIEKVMKTILKLYDTFKK